MSDVGGPHSDLVEEVVRFVDGAKALRPRAPIVADGARIVRDLEEAKRLAYSQHFEDADEDAMSWTDIRENEMANVLGPTYTMPDWAKIEPQLRQATAPFLKKLQAQHGKEQSWLNDVAADLANIAFSRAVFGNADNFFERLWRVYRQGGWPSGWDGAYPAGHLVVYEPPVERR